MEGLKQICLLLLSCQSITCHACKITNQHADCSYQNLTEIPKLPQNITDLNFTGNAIYRLDNNSFQHLPHLRNLLLDNNNISDISEYAFRGLQNLKKLSLSRNHLAVTSASFTKKIFREIPQINFLDMSWNAEGIRTTNLSVYPDEVFADLFNLSELRIDLYPIPRFRLGFRNISNLETLIFQGCFVQNLSNDTFRYFSTIKCLSMRNCVDFEHKVPIIDSGVFQHFPNLKNLDLSGSYFTLPSLMESLYGLKGRTMDILNFDSVNPYHLLWTNRRFYVRVTTHMTRFFRTMCIKQINLSNNGISEIDDKSLFSFQNQTCLETYIISENNFFITEGIQMMYFLVEYVNLRVFDFSYMFVNMPNPKPTKFPSMFESCEIPENNSAGITTYRYFNRNGDARKETQKSKSNITLPCPQKLEIVKLNNLIGQFNLDTHIILKNCNTLELLDVSSTTVSTSNFLINGVDKIRVLNASNLDYNNIEKSVIDSFNKTRYLIIRNANLDILFRNEKFVFESFSELEGLDVAYNHLTELPYKAVANLHNLKNITLFSNSFYQFPSNLLMFKKLRFIDLRFNRISSINTSVLNWFDAMQGNHTIRLLLEGNTFVCNCDNVDFIRWLFKTAIDVVQKESFDCVLQSGERKKMVFVYDNLPVLLGKCSSSFWLTFGVTGISIVTFILVILTTGYRFRWRILYFFYRQCKPEKRLAQVDYDFDAFVAYSGEEYQWILYTLRQKLELEYDLNICLHDREFRLGLSISQNIVDFIRKSKKIVFDITPSYLKAKWCEFELEMAKMEMFQRGTPENVVVVIRGDVQPKDMPRCIKDIWNHVTCIIFPDDGDDAEAYHLFWSRLYHELIS